MAKPKRVPNWRVFVSIIGREIEEKVEKYSIVIPLLLINNNNVSATKMTFKKCWREVNRADETEIVLNQQVFASIVGRETEEKVPLKPLETSPLTISCVSSTECQIYIFLRRKCTSGFSN